MRANVGLVLGFLAVGVLVGCAEEEPPLRSCRVTGLLAPFCEQAAGLSPCECDTFPIDLVAYVDIMNLPNVVLVSSVDGYSNGYEVTGILCAEGEIVVPESAYSPDIEERLTEPPIRARISGAVLRKVTLPGNGVVSYDWAIEIQSLDQIGFYHVVNDTTETPI